MYVVAIRSVVLQCSMLELVSRYGAIRNFDTSAIHMSSSVKYSLGIL